MYNILIFLLSLAILASCAQNRDEAGQAVSQAAPSALGETTTYNNAELSSLQEKEDEKNFMAPKRGRDIDNGSKADIDRALSGSSTSLAKDFKASEKIASTASKQASSTEPSDGENPVQRQSLIFLGSSGLAASVSLGFWHYLGGEAQKIKEIEEDEVLPAKKSSVELEAQRIEEIEEDEVLPPKEFLKDDFKLGGEAQRRKEIEKSVDEVLPAKASFLEKDLEREKRGERHNIGQRLKENDDDDISDLMKKFNCSKTAAILVDQIREEPAKARPFLAPVNDVVAWTPRPPEYYLLLLRARWEIAREYAAKGSISTKELTVIAYETKKTYSLLLKQKS